MTFFSGVITAAVIGTIVFSVWILTKLFLKTLVTTVERRLIHIMNQQMSERHNPRDILMVYLPENILEEHQLERVCVAMEIYAESRINSVMQKLNSAMEFAEHSREVENGSVE